MMNKFLKILVLTLIIGGSPVVWACNDDNDWEDVPGSIADDDYVGKKIYGDNEESKDMSKLRTGIGELLTVDTGKAKGTNSNKSEDDSKERTYLNNEDSVVENRNKMRLNAASQAIAVGQTAVSLGTTSGEDVDGLREEIESYDDILRMLKGIAKLQAQDLQKTNANTGLRAKITELNAIDNIISGNIYTTKKSSGTSE